MVSISNSVVDEMDQAQGTVLPSGITLRARKSRDGIATTFDFSDEEETPFTESRTSRKSRRVTLKLNPNLLRRLERSLKITSSLSKLPSNARQMHNETFSMRSATMVSEDMSTKLSLSTLPYEHQENNVNIPMYDQRTLGDPFESYDIPVSRPPLLVHKPVPLSLDLNAAIIYSNEMHRKFDSQGMMMASKSYLDFRSSRAPIDPCLAPARLTSPDFERFERTGQSKPRVFVGRRIQSTYTPRKIHRDVDTVSHTAQKPERRLHSSLGLNEGTPPCSRMERKSEALAHSTPTTCSMRGSLSHAFPQPLKPEAKNASKEISVQGVKYSPQTVSKTDMIGKGRTLSGHWQKIVNGETRPVSKDSTSIVNRKSQVLSDEIAFHTDKILQTESEGKLPIVPYDQLHSKILQEKSRHKIVETGHTTSDGWLPITFDGKPIFIRKEEAKEQGSGKQTEIVSNYHDEVGCSGYAIETPAEFKQRLTYLFGQMMFVSGETAEPSAETTWMIEEVVREQVVEMLKEATALANRRGSKSISIVDLIFQIRHNTAKVSRLKTFLSWKDVRKNVKDSDDKGGGDADAIDLEDSANLPGANPSSNQKSSTNKKAKLTLPWEVQSYFSETVPEREDEEDEEEEEQNDATIARLAAADERTKNMTRDEYVYWSDCRQASFTFRKGKRFREWAGFGTVIDSKPNDDVVDILGFLTFEIVQTITEEALKVKAIEDVANKKANSGRGDAETSKKRKREGCSLFEMPEEGRTPVEPKHVREAFRRLQAVPNKYKYMRPGYAGMRTPLKLI